MTVAELMERVSEREFQEWMIFEQTNPFDDSRSDYQAALICLTLYNVMRDPKTSQELTLDDFLIEFKAAKSEDEEEQDGGVDLTTIARMMGANVVRHDGDVS